MGTPPPEQAVQATDAEDESARSRRGQGLYFVLKP